jgi:hypothetical protein
VPHQLRQRAEEVASSMTISCASAPIARATSRAYSSSLNARSLKATEKV